MKLVDLGEPTSLVLTCTWDALNVNANDTLFEECRQMFESRISAGGTEKFPGLEKLRAKTVAWSFDMEGDAIVR